MWSFALTGWQAWQFCNSGIFSVMQKSTKVIKLAMQTDAVTVNADCFKHIAFIV